MGRLLKEVHVLHNYPFLREHALEGRRRAFPAEDSSRLGVDLPVDPLRLVPAYLPDVGSPFFYASLSLAIASVAIKFIRFFITRYGAKKAHSKARVADAWHQIIDALSSIAAIIALTGFYYRNGKNILDPILSYPIAVRVIFIGIETFKQSTRELTDHAIDHDKRKEVKDILSKYIDRSKIKEVKSRIFSEKFYLDIILLEDQEKTLKEADRLSDQRKEDLRKHFDNLKDVTIRTLPDNPEHQKKNY